MIFDSYTHLVSTDQVRFPANPISGKLAPGEFDDPMTAEKLIAAMDQAGVDTACAVQRAHVYGHDNSYTFDCAARFPKRLRAVVALNVLDPATPGRLTAMVSKHIIAGVRFGAPGFPEAPIDWLTADAAIASWRAAIELGLPVCVHVLHVQRDLVLAPLKQMIARFPGAIVVIDHVGGAHAANVEKGWLASVGREPGPEWSDDMLRLTDCANAVMKLSSINLEGSCDPAGFTARAVALFGAERLIWGSDAGQSREPYAHMVELAKAALAGLADPAQQAIIGSNARRIYGVD